MERNIVDLKKAMAKILKLKPSNINFKKTKVPLKKIDSIVELFSGDVGESSFGAKVDRSKLPKNRKPTIQQIIDAITQTQVVLRDFLF